LIHLCSKQADIAHVMLGARIRATREMNVYRLIQLQLLLKVARQLDGLTFCVRR
jgi:hypothetical protein